MRLRFVAPIIPPTTLSVAGALVREGGDLGEVEVTIRDAIAGTRYVEARYEFSTHRAHNAAEIGQIAASASKPVVSDEVVLITGARGGLGNAVAALLGKQMAVISVSREDCPGLIQAATAEEIASQLAERPIRAIIHCGWPPPDNERLLALADVRAALDFNLTTPIQEVLSLAQLLARLGSNRAPLVLIGSTASRPGRHNYRSPLYSLAKSLIPPLSRVLATELAATGRRCIALTYDVIETGMNADLAPRARVAHIDRSPFGALASAEEAAAQIAWLIENESFLVSGATIDLIGAALP
jgi:NAD(P)-dependent dehydrogenase (short-subunit alcohol dehydrogenase family)